MMRFAREYRSTHGRPRAFTLVEMMVSLAVLTLALGVVGVVFSVTTRTATRAAAYSEAQNYVRQLVAQLQKDLAHCDPSQSVLVLAGRTQAAGLTQEDLDAGRFHRVLVGSASDVEAGYDPEYDLGLDSSGEYSNPRADVMMFFSNRATASVAPYDNPDSPYWAGGKFAPIAVTYGHAALAAPVAGGGSDYNFGSARHIEQSGTNGMSIIPVSQWHLSRAAVILESPEGSPQIPADVRVAQSAAVHLAACQPYDPNMPGDVAMFNAKAFLSLLQPNAGWGNPALARPYDYPGSGWHSEIRNSINTLMYRSFSRWPQAPLYHHVATVLEEVPINLRTNLGVQMLPGCAWFQVEFLMPEDPRNSLDFLSNPQYADDLVSQRSDLARWTAIAPGETYVFIPDTQENRDAVARQLNGAGQPVGRLADFARIDQEPGLDASGVDVVASRRIRMWPYAIRVTLHVYDPRGRLEEPIIRSFVHRFE